MGFGTSIVLFSIPPQNPLLKEAIGKLSDPEKSMILSQFGKMAQKGDFAVTWSFPIASKGTISRSWSCLN